MLASPLLLKAFRRLPWVTLLAPIALTAVIGTGLVTVPGTFGEGLLDFAVFGSCWVLGFAHNDGLLKEIPRYIAVSSAAIVMGFGLWWASGHLTEEGWNLDEIPLAQATWSLGFCAILLVYAPSWQKLPGRLAGWDSLVTLANNRAVTIYLWHNLLLMAAAQLVDQLWSVPWFGDTFGTYIEQSYEVLVLIAIWPLTGLAITGVRLGRGRRRQAPAAPVAERAPDRRAQGLTPGLRRRPFPRSTRAACSGARLTAPPAARVRARLRTGHLTAPHRNADSLASDTGQHPDPCGGA